MISFLLNWHKIMKYGINRDYRIHYFTINPFFTIVHQVYAPRATQDRGLMNEVVT